METKGGHSQQVLKTGPRREVCSFKGDPKIWDTFKNEVWGQGLTVCQVIEAFMTSFLRGEEAKITEAKRITVNLTMEHIVQRPRRMIDAWQPKKLVWPPCCEYAGDFIKSTKEVGCLQMKDFIPLSECWRCFRLSNSQ